MLTKFNLSKLHIDTQDQHSFATIINNSPWPILTSISLLLFIEGGLFYNQFFQIGLYELHFGFFFLFIIINFWCFDLLLETTYSGTLTYTLRWCIRYGMFIFIISEVMFFFGFFWAFFHSSIVPDFHIGSIWPPKHIVVISPWGLPFVNTLLLLTSGVTLTVSFFYISLTRFHIYQSHQQNNIFYLYETIWLAVLFLYFQRVEYISSTYTMADSVYGASFFLLTGFHGAHVILGTLFLISCAIRMLLNHVSLDGRFINFELASFYWHFVDIVWIFLFFFVYIWGSNI